MQLVFLVIQITIALAIIACVLLQRNGVDSLGSLGGGSGINGGNIISGRTTATFLSRATTVLMICFMVNSLILGNLSVRQHHKTSVIEQSTKEAKQPSQAPVSE